MQGIDQPASFEDMMYSRVVPLEEARSTESLAGQQLSMSDAVRLFITKAMKEVLDDPRVQSDLSKRVQAVTGGKSGNTCNSGHDSSHTSCDHDCHHSYITLLDELAVPVIEQSALTFSNVLKRGKQGESLDQSTAGYIRRQIFTESTVRAIVKRSHSEYLSQLEAQSKEGVLFAFPKPDQFSHEDLNIIDSHRMGQLMTMGVVVIPSFYDPSPCFTELTRMDALAMMRPLGDGFFSLWTTRDKLRQYSSVDAICDRLTRIPFELNSKNKDLLLQVVSQFQLNMVTVPREIGGFGSTQKFACIFPVFKSITCRVIVMRNDGSESTVNVERGDLIILNLSFVKTYKILEPVKFFQISTFITGPNK
jgi:hypothetical protein